MALRQENQGDTLSGLTQVTTNGTHATDAGPPTAIKSVHSAVNGWNTHGYFGAALSILDGDVIIVRSKMEFGGAGANSTWGITTASSLSAHNGGTDGVFFLFQTGNVLDVTNGTAFVDGPFTHTIATYFFHRMTFSPTGCLCEQSSDGISYSTLTTVPIDFVGTSCIFQANYFGQNTNEYFMDFYTWNSSPSSPYKVIPGSQASALGTTMGYVKSPIPGDGNTLGSSYGHIKGA